MALSVPKGYVLDKNIDPKVLRKKKYLPYTIADLLEFVAELDPDTPVWINTWDEELDDAVIRPVEMLSSSSDTRGPYLMIG
jgi:hypothetical protein